MKLSIVLLIVSIFQVSAAGYAQKVTLSLKNASLETVLAEIKQQTSYNFLYIEDMLQNSRPVSVHVTNADLKDVLDKCFKNQPLTYTIEEKMVIVKERAVKEAPAKSTQVERIDVTGKVTDEKGGALPGATIKVKGADISTVTNSEGEFNLKNVGADAVLQISFMGFETQEVSVTSGQRLNIVLKEEAKGLNEVVVLGFGQTQKKIAQTGAIASVTMKEIKQSPVANISNALAGRLPGLIAVQRSGEPGADAPELYIRGLATFNSNSPLITIDGVQKENTALNTLDPNEIESVTILKDASATALYGVKGANGVIIVKTRRGKEGKTVINASLQTAIQSPTRLPKFLDSYQYGLLLNEAKLNDNPLTAPTALYSNEVLEAYRTGSDPYKYPNVNWMEEMLQPASMTRADFNISGGSKVAKYFVNVGYTDQSGLYKAEKNDQYNPALKFKRYNFRSNTDLDFNKNFSIALSLFGSIQDKNSTRAATDQMFTWLIQTTPNAFPIKYPNGLYGGSRVNPFVLLNENGYTQGFDSSLSGMLNVTEKLDFITPGLSVKGTYSFDGNYENDLTRTKSIQTGLYKGTGDYNDINSYTLAETNTPLGTPSNSFAQLRNTAVELSVNYAKSFGAHNVSALLLANRQQKVAGGDILNRAPYNVVAGAAIPYVSQGLASRLTYSYKNKYFGEINAGYNGTDNFAKGKRYGFFPAGSLGWLISEENFLKDNKIINTLKLRGSYGIVGNDVIDRRRWLFVSEYINGTGYNYGDQLALIGGKVEGPMENPDVTWETAHKSNIGLEASLVDNLFDITVDVFHEKRSDILKLRESVPGILGVSSANQAAANIGVVVNRGIEAEMTHRKRLGRMNYFVKANGSFARNKVLFQDEVTRTYAYQNRTGQPLRQLFGLTAIGFFQSKDEIQNSPKQFGNLIPGDIKYKDMNGDGVIDTNDEGPIGRSTVPEFLYGISGGLNWRNFDVSLLFQGAGNYNVGFTHASAWEFYNGASVMQHHLGRWTPETAATATYPVLHNGQNDNNHRAGSSFFMKDASYLRLKNLELGYTFKNIRFTKSVGLSSVRLYANGMNLLTWDKMGEGSFDPEAPSGNGFFYPQVKVFNFGLSTDF